MPKQLLTITGYLALAALTIGKAIQIIVTGEHHFRSAIYTQAEDPGQHYLTLALLWLIGIGSLAVAISTIQKIRKK